MSERVNIPNYLWQSITVTVLCCLPFGIPAIVYAAKVNGLVANNQIEEALVASSKAKMWCWLGLGFGLIAIFAQIILQGGAILAAMGAAGEF